MQELGELPESLGPGFKQGLSEPPESGMISSTLKREACIGLCSNAGPGFMKELGELPESLGPGFKQGLSEPPESGMTLTANVAIYAYYI